MADEKNIGTKIKSIRESKQITAEELAERSQLSVDQINNIENDTNVPSLAPLIKIARALGVRLGTFLDDDENLGPAISRKNEAVETIHTSNAEEKTVKHNNFFALAPQKSGRAMEPFFIEINAIDDGTLELSAHEGEEFIYVLEGTLKIIYGQNTYILNAGDSIYYDSIVSHLVCAADEKGAKIIASVYAPA
ncbi:helix-turn-helix domain-containing protein [Methanimicrococcus blatticola]|uniref:XRE family transcriptional regulator n=1 Tax=Methanimicrococcus blatticola TaxID=91560 RepID=A0A484F3L8_9EURY|nr:XRE family transcriptional regulator [Methanimicrococcus blatticola]MBZ3936084.1 XRE family transcriptional regulator [Methanimicrococcus blatticola]MCC2509307.1 XRE family transcriptional regulator [Methanimicrococcus blatticola]TDQ68193.1 XRE family transcriptional regulator [Methanimicrococcus blatticola]